MSGQGLGRGMRSVLIGGFAILLVAASVLLPAEATALRHTNEHVLISSFLDGASVQAGRGQDTVSRQLSGCFAAVDRVSGPLFRREARRAVVSGCTALAKGRLEQVPGHAAAHQLHAEALMALGQVTQAMQAALAGEARAPNTAWLDQRRVVLLARIQPASEAGSQLFDRAVARLARTPETRLWLAKGYRRDPALRAAINQSTTAIPGSDARSLIAVIQRLNATAVLDE